MTGSRLTPQLIECLTQFMNQLDRQAQLEGWTSSGDSLSFYGETPMCDVFDCTIVEGEGVYRRFCLADVSMLVSLEIWKQNEPYNVNVVVYCDPSGSSEFAEPLFVDAGHSDTTLTSEYAKQLISKICSEFSP